MAGDTTERHNYNPEEVNTAKVESVEPVEKYTPIDIESEYKLNNVAAKPDNTDDQKNADKKDGDNKTAAHENKTSHYLENLKNSNSSPGLVLNDKDGTLLSDPKTVVKFSPVWRQVRAFYL
jgi:hypothetical protein